MTLAEYVSGTQARYLILWGNSIPAPGPSDVIPISCMDNVEFQTYTQRYKLYRIEKVAMKVSPTNSSAFYGTNNTIAGIEVASDPVSMINGEDNATK